MSVPPIHICFYSNSCKWSKAFLEELAQTPYKKEFRYVCIDPSPNRPSLPSFLNPKVNSKASVPCILITGEPEPRFGSDVMNWLYEKRMKETAKQASTQANSPDGAPGGEPMGWNSMEHVSFAKGFGYSFNDSDTTNDGNGGLRLPGAFSLLNGQAATGERTANEFPGGSQQGRSKTKKEELFDKQMEAYQRAREEGMPKVAARQ
jgi:hypothetical protein